MCHGSSPGSYVIHQLSTIGRKRTGKGERNRKDKTTGKNKDRDGVPGSDVPTWRPKQKGNLQDFDRGTVRGGLVNLP